MRDESNRRRVLYAESRVMNEEPARYLVNVNDKVTS